MTRQLREGVDVRKREVALDGEVECDEFYVIAEHKGHPTAVKKGRGDAVRLRNKSRPSLA